MGSVARTGDLTVLQAPAQLAGLLDHPGGGGVGGAAREVDAPRAELDEEQHEHGLEEQRLDREEVTREEAVAERWVRSARQECLNHLLIVSEAQLRRVLTTYVTHYNEARPHQGLGQRTPVPCGDAGPGPVRRRDVLSGLLHEYYREVA